MTPCPHRPPCPGCPRYGEAGLAAPVQAALARIAGAHGLPPVEVESGAVLGFRHRARLALREVEGAPAVGLFEAGSHRLVPVPRCGVHHPLINEVAAEVQAALAAASIRCYDEATGTGLARYLQVAIERGSQSAQVVLVANAGAPGPLARVFERLRQRLGSRLHSLWFNEQRGRGNAILGPRFMPVCGPGSVVERFGGAAIHYPPGAFGQANLDLAERLVADLRGQVPPGARVAEFHAGVGAIGLSLLGRAASVAMNEVSAASLHGLELGLAGLAPAERERVRVAPGPAREQAMLADGADVVVVDPPRKGLEPALLARLASHAPERLLYVSCGLAAFERDVAGLVAGGRLRLAALRAWDLMPHTGHVELVGRFERA